MYHTVLTDQHSVVSFEPPVSHGAVSAMMVAEAAAKAAATAARVEAAEADAVAAGRRKAPPTPQPKKAPPQPKKAPRTVPRHINMLQTIFENPQGG